MTENANSSEIIFFAKFKAANHVPANGFAHVKVFCRKVSALVVLLQHPLMNCRLRTGIYAGTFDPPTSGHLDIINRGASLCDKLYVGVAINTSKKPIFSLDRRIELLKKITKKHNGLVEVVPVEGLLSEYVMKNNIDFFLRGVRSF